jgi:hypothetical protein
VESLVDSVRFLKRRMVVTCSDRLEYMSLRIYTGVQGESSVEANPNVRMGARPG